MKEIPSGLVIAWDPCGHAEVFGSAADCALRYGCTASTVVRAIERDDGVLTSRTGGDLPVAFLDWLYTGES